MGDKVCCKGLVVTIAKIYNQFYDELERLKELSKSNSTLGSEVYRDAIGDGWHDNFAFEQTMRDSRLIAKRIDDMLEKRKYLKVVKDNRKKII